MKVPVAITSASQECEVEALFFKKPLTGYYGDKVVLRQRISFLPKVVSALISSSKSLLSLCLSPVHQKEKILWSGSESLLTTASFRKADSLFVLMYGPNKGEPASSSTISRWLRLTTIQSYGLKDQIPPFLFKGHCTKSARPSH